MVEHSPQQNVNNLAQRLNGLSLAPPNRASQTTGMASGVTRQLQEAAVNSDLASADPATLLELVFESMTLEDKMRVAALARARGLLHTARAQNPRIPGPAAGMPPRTPSFAQMGPTMTEQMQRYRQEMQALHPRSIIIQQPSSGRGTGLSHDTMRQFEEDVVNADFLQIKSATLAALKAKLGLLDKDLLSLTLEEKQRLCALAKAYEYRPYPPGTPQMQPQDMFSANLMGTNFDAFGFEASVFGQGDGFHGFHGFGDIGDLSEWFNDQGLMADKI